MSVAIVMPHALVRSCRMRPFSMSHANLATVSNCSLSLPGRIAQKFRSTNDSSAAATNKKTELYDEYHSFTHGGNFWRDNYLLHKWASCEQPVVYLGEVYNGYKLLLRLGDWCWLTKDPQSGEYLTIKFLGRSRGHKELKITQDISQSCQSPYISALRDNFKVPHRLAKVDPRYTGIEFDAIVYPTTGTDLRRISTPCEKPYVTLSLKRRKQCIRHLVLGTVALHKTGIVHGDLHPGNLALPPPPAADIDQFLAIHQPRVHDVRRLDGRPTPPNIPERVTEPVEFGFNNEGDSKIFDYGFAFRAVDGASYNGADLPIGTPLPPELLHKGATTTLPFKVESWHLGICIYYILTHGMRIVDRGIWQTAETVRHHYEERVAALSHDQSEVYQEIPEALREGFRPVLLSLLCQDPTRRALPEELVQNKWLMDEDQDGL